MPSRPTGGAAPADMNALAMVGDRRRCPLCCGLYAGAVVGAAALTLHAPFTYFRPRRVPLPTNAAALLDRYLFVAAPFAAIAALHHGFLAAALWSRRRNTLLEAEVVSLGAAAAVWGGGVAVGTAVSRFYLPRVSRRWRQLQFDRRVAARNAKVTHPFVVDGTLSNDASPKQLLVTLAIYCTLVGGLAYTQLYQQGSVFALPAFPLFREACSPRWREWSEAELAHHMGDADVRRGGSVSGWHQPSLHDFASMLPSFKGNYL